MSTTINFRDVNDARELDAAMAILVADSCERSEAVYIRLESGAPARLTLVEEVLSDGSIAHNIIITEAP